MWAPRTGRVTSVVVLVLFVLVAVGTPVGVAGTPDAPPTQQRTPDVFAQQGVDTDSVRLVVSLHENGSASWEVQYWTRLDDENTTAAFESLQADVEANPDNYTERFASRMRKTVAAAENSTGREMTATNFTISAETRTPPQYGVVVYGFEWDGFAAVDGDGLRVGDAIEGLFLDEQTRLVVEWPSDYALSEVAPDPDERREGAVVWRGSETSFVSGEPHLVLTSRDGTATPGGGTGGDTGGGGTGGDGGDGGSDAGTGGGVPVAVVVGALLVLAALGVGAWRWRGKLRTVAGGETAEGATADETATDETTAGETTAGETTAGTPAEEARPELLSNEERVLKFVEEQGGRVKQQEIVQAFDWTEARTSQIVRDLRDEGKLEGFRLGRENVLKLPDDES